MIPDEVRVEITKRISSVQQEHGVRVLYAVESGSRAWGFESPDSDFDVRFIYAHPREWYIAVDLEEKRDVIEYDITDDIDLNGWDLRKSLRLLQKSNPALIEWLHSPIVYEDDGQFASQTRSFIQSAYSSEKGISSYRGLAKNNLKLYLRDERRSPKRCLYILRSILCAKWVEKHRSPPPVPFEEVRSILERGTELDLAIEDLLRRKKKDPEAKAATSFPVIDEYLVRELERLEANKTQSENEESVIARLNTLFHANLCSNGPYAP